MRLFLRNFPPYSQVELEFPLTGLFVIQGDNGSGKSSILEAYCTALFAKSLRGASPWRDRTDLRIEIGSITVDRTEKKLAVDEAEALKPTKKKPELASLVGPWEVFTRTRVFDADLTARFGASTDSEKKKLLEKLLGLEFLEERLKTIRADLRAKLGAQTAAAQKAEVAKAGLRERPEVKAPDAAAIESARQAVCELEKQIRDLAKEEGAHSEKKRELETRLVKLDQYQCPLCESQIPFVTVTRLREELCRAKEAMQAAEAQRKQSGAQGARALADLRTLQAVQTAAEESRKAANRRAELQRDYDLAKQTEENEGRELTVLREVESFFTAARPRMLEELLAGIHRVASAWLATLTDWPFHLWLEGDDLKLKLGDRQYKELSRGQRRRVDLAILLACSQLHGGGTVKHALFLDECLDGVDKAGCDAFASLLEAVAENELVIVLTHSEELAGRLRGIHYHCEAGTITRRK